MDTTDKDFVEAEGGLMNHLGIHRLGCLNQLLPGFVGDGLDILRWGRLRSDEAIPFLLQHRDVDRITAERSESIEHGYILSRRYKTS